jgi:protein TonB
MFDLVTGKTTHIPSRPGAPIVISTLLQAAIVGAVLLPALFLTGALPEPQMMMAFVAAPPPPPPPPPPPAPAQPKPAETKPSPTRPVLVTQEQAAPLEPPSEIQTEPVGVEEGVPGGVEGGVPGGVVGGVVGGLPEAPPPPPPPSVRRDPVRVGGQIQEPRLLRRVEPIYPPLAVSAHIEGVVILEAIVDREGQVEQVRVLRSPNPMLDKASIDAVKQWRYAPVLLNGKPERFILTVVLSFGLTTS